MIDIELNSKGIYQALKNKEKLTSIKFDKVFSSPLKRAIESIMAFRKQNKDFLDDIRTNYKGKDILIVTHAGVSIYIRCYYEGKLGMVITTLIN